MVSIAHIKPKNADSSIFILLSILLGGMFVRIWGIWDYMYNPDEMQFLLLAKGGTLAEVWRRGLSEVHPPLSNFIHHYLLLIAPSVFSQRLFSAAAGVISILAMYRLGSVLRGAAMGLFCAMCMAFMPVAVSTSITIRNYAFFMAFLSWALFFFIRYQKTGSKRDLGYFTCLIMLASSTHFTGFMVAAACGISEGWRLLWAKRWNSLMVFCASYLPLTLLAVFFYLHYLAPGTAGPMYNQFFRETLADKSSFASIAISVIGYFIPFLNLLEHLGLTTAGPALFCAFAGGIVLMVLHVMGLRRMYSKAPEIFYLVIALWVIALAIAFADMYPFAATRHNVYFLPLFMLPFWYAIEPLAHHLLAKRHATYAAVMLVAMVTAGMEANHYYLWYGEELTLKQTDFNAGQKHLESHLQPGDVIASERNGYFYLLDAKDNGATAYDSYADAPYFHDTTILAPFDPPFKPYKDWKPFHDTLASQLAEKNVSAKGSLWFIIYGAPNMEIQHLMTCPALRPHIDHFFSRDSVVVFSVFVPAMKTFIQNIPAWERCYHDYHPSLTGGAFPAVQLPPL